MCVYQSEPGKPNLEQEALEFLVMQLVNSQAANAADPEKYLADLEEEFFKGFPLYLSGKRFDSEVQTLNYLRVIKLLNSASNLIKYHNADIDLRTA